MAKIIHTSPKKAGNVNAAFVATIYDKQGKELGTCMDTPNNMAYAFAINEKADTITGWLSGAVKRDSLKDRFAWITKPADAQYHSQYVKYL